ncbi:MAG: hypothetical protein DYG89_22300 [Caldilinea sp. CFX5]|nr:hypothetical protein [Caldilinea sp. CFX5]
MMSPTLLEAAIVLVLIILGWQIGIQLAPQVLSYWRTARRQLDQIEQTDDRQLEQAPSAEQPLSSRKENTNDKAIRPKQDDSITYL